MNYKNTIIYRLGAQLSSFIISPVVLLLSFMTPGLNQNLLITLNYSKAVRIRRHWVAVAHAAKVSTTLIIPGWPFESPPGCDFFLFILFFSYLVCSSFVKLASKQASIVKESPFRDL